jgi:hypothetical protein
MQELLQRLHWKYLASYATYFNKLTPASLAILIKVILDICLMFISNNVYNNYR